ncbi:protoheme IX farnesyltransferase [Acidihalobacter yilgarnensis]|uniref:Protoheme IX farnesyltransferase n=1 Tax=Acidihalobacter yilgarnensis TaxID=2819280 RepID=A0A1D8IN75_9GAMM|nr:heme o synthase [Acidihalobacter yilgarnensis]AOU97923.1 protoheme IX farnesyltransferase [Acidihalobacter yilgarnensis]
MNEIELDSNGQASIPPAKPSLIGDLLTLAKARVVSLLVFTAIVGELLAPDFWHHWSGALAGLAGIALAGGAGGVLNQLVEPLLDQHMRRTRRRPLVSGRITQGGAVLYAIALFSGSVTILANWTNPITLLLTLFGTIGYGIIYTLYLKPSTPWNIVWGGLAGALPPLIGWTAVGAPITAPLPWLLVALIFVWTPAHFWPLALYFREDYAKACIPMLPVTHGVERTRAEIVKYALATIAVSLTPALFGAGLPYAAVAAVSGIWYTVLTIKLKRMPVGVEMDRFARRVFSASISYLFILYAALIGDHLLQMIGIPPL